MKEKIKKYIGEIILLIGAFMMVYNILNFSSSRGCGLSLDINDECNNPVAYFYSGSVRFMAGFGLALLIAGIIIIKRRNRKNSE